MEFPKFPSVELLSSQLALHVLVPGFIPPQMWDFVYPLVEINEIPLCPVLEPVEVQGFPLYFCLLNENCRNLYTTRIAIHN